MRVLACCSAVALIWLSPFGPAAAQSPGSAPAGAQSSGSESYSGPTGESEKERLNQEGTTGQDAMTNTGGPGTGQGERRTHTMPSQSGGASNKPPLQLSEDQRSAIIGAVSSEDTYQKTPANFEPRIGIPITSAIKPHPLPSPLINQIPELKQYYYAKLDSNVLVIDPMNKHIVDVIPHQSASGEKPVTPADWAATEGRQLLGKPPETTGGPPAPSEPMQERYTPESSAPAR